jgi:sugar lactone lactonase YvrE
VALLAAGFFLLYGYGLDRLRRDRAFSMVIVIGTLVLPQLAAFPVRFMGWDIPTNASEVMAIGSQNILQIGLFLVPLTILSVIIGLLWNPRLWLVNAAIWYGIFTIFYTSMFTNGAGFFTGLVGSLGYWLEQQGVQRGSQPAYYYALIQVPIYEYLPMLGTWLAFGIAIWDWITAGNHSKARAIQEEAAVQLPLLDAQGLPNGQAQPEADEKFQLEPAPVFPLLGFWAVTSLIAFSVAGEKMPWLTVHITLPAILCTGWALGRLIDNTRWSLLRERSGWLVLILLPIFLVSTLASIGSLLGTQPPFQGKELAQLQATSQFMTSLLVSFVSGAGLIYLIIRWPVVEFVRILTLSFFALLGVLTARTSIQANYYAYDNANELLVYAHSAPGVKTALGQIEEISRRTTDGMAIQVAYDNETSYPYWWYLRNFPNAQYYHSNPSRSLRDVPIILVGDANYGKIEPVVANLYDKFDYIRLWWPNQDYYNLTWERVRNALLDPAMRAALFEVWLNRDYTDYGKVLGRDMSLTNWSPAARMRLYIRKDITSQLWNYGSAPEPVEEIVDPFDGKYNQIPAASLIGSVGTEPGMFLRPRDVAVAPDGSIYVADTDNHRIQHISPDGNVLQVWGSFGDVTTGSAPGGTFNQPWGIAAAPDGSVYVADTWNHRIQKFSSTGEFIQMWGYFGQAEQPEAFWGPRDVAVDSGGNFYVTDTGNKRVVVFDENGAYLAQFGEAGMGPGQLDEPVGIAVDRAGMVYVADTWNQRIQVFQPNVDGGYTSSRSWEVQAWFGQSLDNKPFLAVDDSGNVFTTDPEGYRVLQFTNEGEPVLSWGDYGTDSTQFGLPVGIAAGQNGDIWVVDTGNSRLMRFVLSPQSES